MNESEKAYVVHRSRPVTEAVVSNMAAARDMPYALGPRTAERSGMFVCVGAGPSLKTTGPELPRLQREGALICTVNTALSAVNRYCMPDVVLTREIVDVSSHLAHPAGLRVLDLCAGVATWAKAREMGPCAWFVTGSANYFELAAEYGVRPLFGGPAAMTALVSLCEEWGAVSIVLVGCDLALADDGTSYAAGSAFDGQRADIGADGMAVNSGAGFARKLEQHASGGVEAYPTREGTVVVERYGGGQIRTTTQWVEQIPWLANFAARHPDITCIDATGAGARKAGWIEWDAARVWLRVDSVTVDPRPPGWSSSWFPGQREAYVARMQRALPPAAHDAAREHVLGQCRVAAAVCANVLHPEGGPVAVPRFMQGTDLVDAAAARDVLAATEMTGTTAAKIRAVYGKAIPDAARTLERLAGGDSLRVLP